MYIVVDWNGSDVEMTWHVGKFLPIASEDVKHIKEVQADGDELEYIKNNFSHMPVNVNRRVNRWFGEMARFIVANLT